jgi:hypothetical protein
VGLRFWESARRRYNYRKDQRTFDVESLRKALVSTRRADPVLLILLAGLWLWKIAEFAGRSTGLLRRNLGWGFVVDVAIPVVFTLALAVFFLVRRLASLRR